MSALMGDKGGHSFGPTFQMYRKSKNKAKKANREAPGFSGTVTTKGRRGKSNAEFKRITNPLSNILGT